MNVATHGIIGETATTTINPEDKGDEQIQIDGRIVAVWADGPQMFVGIKADGLPYPHTCRVEDCEIEGWA